MTHQIQNPPRRQPPPLNCELFNARSAQGVVRDLLHLDDVHVVGLRLVPTRHVVEQLARSALDRRLAVLAVHVVHAHARAVLHPETVVLRPRRFGVLDLVHRQNLSTSNSKTINSRRNRK